MGFSSLLDKEPARRLGCIDLFHLLSPSLCYPRGLVLCYWRLLQVTFDH